MNDHQGERSVSEAPRCFSMWNGLAPLLAVAFSGGGGDGFDGAGLPLLQSCDAINVCRVPCVKHNGIPCWVDPTTGVLRNARLPGTRDNGMVVQELVCPNGMTAVAPPERSPVYTLTAASSTYIPGELLHLELRVTQRLIVGKMHAGRRLETRWNESAKYIGLLLYAVRTGDATEAKVGNWEIPLQVRAPDCQPAPMPRRYAYMLLRSARSRPPLAASTDIPYTSRPRMRQSRADARGSRTKGLRRAISLPRAGGRHRLAHLSCARQAGRDQPRRLLLDGRGRAPVGGRGRWRSRRCRADCVAAATPVGAPRRSRPDLQ